MTGADAIAIRLDCSCVGISPQVSFITSAKKQLPAGGAVPDLSMMAEAGALDPLDETFREYERVVDAKYLDEIRTQAKQFSTKLLSRQSALAECAIRKFKKGSNAIKPRSLRKLIRTIHDLQNALVRNGG